MDNCPRCNSSNLRKNGIERQKKQYICKDCGYHFTIDRQGKTESMKYHVNRRKKKHRISRKNFLKQSLATGFFLNMGVVSSAMGYHNEVRSDHGDMPKGAKQFGEDPEYWHNMIRNLRYQPDDGDFVIKNGVTRFNRALYGTNTGFRIEGGDLPEFALWMPGLGGTLRFGLMTDATSKWLIDADEITARYRPGTMIYEIRDSILEAGTLKLQVLAMANGDGMLIRIDASEISADHLQLVCAFGGASNDYFSRNGDMPSIPRSAFSLLPEHCRGNEYKLNENTFELRYGENMKKHLSGVISPDASVHLADAGSQKTPADFIASTRSTTPAVAATIPVDGDEPIFTNIYNPNSHSTIDYASIPVLFNQAEKVRKELVGRAKLSTPDSFINPFAGALSVAGDALWEPPSYFHGAVAWRDRLNGWRGAYVGDPLGWHDRARMHFSSYAESQLTSPDSGPVVPDPEANLSRQKMEIGTAVYTSGYICPEPGGVLYADHYDMNLDTIAELLQHFRWTGDWAYIKEMWPMIKRHLAWEKRCFDGDGDGLYDAYAAIWASDSLQYSAGRVVHSSAFNYSANKWAAFIAERIGEDAAPYQAEAEKIRQAVNTKLWKPNLGRYAEYQDFNGLENDHSYPGLWTVYHVMDSGLPDPFRAYQLLRYVDTEIPDIPVKAKGLPDGDWHIHSTTNWMPYTYSLNNVAMAELLHTSLAYWQTGRTEEAFRLWKSTIIADMYLGFSPGNFPRTSFYDAMGGQAYRDFGDPIGIAARTLVEGLFGIVPDAMNGELLIRPGLPKAWDHASLEVPDISYQFKRTDKKDRYVLESHFSKKLDLHFKVHAIGTEVKRLKVNGQDISWKSESSSVGQPVLEFQVEAQPKYEIDIEWSGESPEIIETPDFVARGDQLSIKTSEAEILDVHDPQNVLDGSRYSENALTGEITDNFGHRTFFVKLRQDDFTWWAPVCFEIREAVDVIPSSEQGQNHLKFTVKNNASSRISGRLSVSAGSQEYHKKIRLASGSESSEVLVGQGIVPGTNAVDFMDREGKTIKGKVINWNLHCPPDIPLDPVDISEYFNDKVTNIFQEEKYLSPRPPYPTLQLPTQGIGNWASPLVQVDIDDSGLRKLAKSSNQFMLPQGIPFNTPGRRNARNIIFTSQWDNYPEKTWIPLSGSASHAYFLMAGSTNPMQSRFVNGEVVIEYQDGSKDCLRLENPETWWPIEQDYYIDGHAFELDMPKPIRVHLKTGLITQEFENYTSIDGFTDYAIEGGAATVLDLPLDSTKKLKGLHLKTLANDVVIGLMSLTLIRA